MDVSANKGVSGDAFVVGVDFGTLSARALVVRVSDGAEAGTAVSEYPHGVRRRSNVSTTFFSTDTGPERRCPVAMTSPCSEPASPQVGYPSSGPTSTGTCFRRHATSATTTSDSATPTARREAPARKPPYSFLPPACTLRARWPAV